MGVAVMKQARQGLIGPTLVAATLVGSIVSSFGAPLIPTIAAAFDEPVSTAQWSLTVALLVGTVASPVLGRLGDGAHRRATLLTALGVVTLGGILSAVAGGLGGLIAGRALQGLGLALAPVTMAIAKTALPRERVPAMIALLSVSSAAGLGLGYPLSGWLADTWGLSGAYGFGALVSALALVGAATVLPASSGAGVETRYDWAGTVLLAAALTCLMIAVAQGSDWGWASPATLGLVVCAVAATVIWVLQQLRSQHPLMALRTLRTPAVLAGDVCALVLGTAMYMVLTGTTSFVQTPASAGFGFGASAIVSGLVLVPLSVLMFLCSRLLPKLMRALGARAVLILGCLVAASGCVFFAVVHTSLWQAFVMSALLGVGLGLTFAAIPGTISAAVPASQTGSSIGFYQVLRFTGFALGTALTAALLTQLADDGGRLTEAGHVSVLWVAAGLCAAAAVLVRCLHRQ